MLTHFNFTQPKYLFYSNPEGGYIVVQGGHLQYKLGLGIWWKYDLSVNRLF